MHERGCWRRSKGLNHLDVDANRNDLVYHPTTI